MVSHTWLGANDYSYVRALRRAGHSVRVVSDEGFFASDLRNPVLRAARRIASPFLLADYQRGLLEEAEGLEPHLFFVFKGTYVKAETIARIKANGAVAINFYPDVGLASESRSIAEAMGRYDWVFTSKSFRVEELKRHYRVAGASFLPHAYDPEVHRPTELDADDVAKFGCEVGFVGTWSWKKEQMLAGLRAAMPDLNLKIWGNQWERAATHFGSALMRKPVLGVEYAKAIQASQISLALLVEAPIDADSGDLTTARTFEIPAVGACMLHERTSEASGFFEEGRECAMFDEATGLVDAVRRLRGSEEARIRIAAAGHARALSSGYSYDARAQAVIDKAISLLEEKSR